MKILKKLKKSKAFTLIEMLLVLLIISLLLILIIPNIAKQTAHIQSTGCDAQVKMVNSQIEAYTLKHNRNPNNIEELIAEGFIKEGQKNCKSGQTISISNGELLRTKQYSAFTLIEMMLVLFTISVLLMTTLWSRSFMNVQMINEEHEIKQFITRLNYFKSKAIASQRSIALVFTNNSNVIQVVEEKGSKYKIKVPHGKITNIARINTLNFNRDGNINRFGSLTIAMNKATYKIILHIEKGRIRYVKFKLRASLLLDSLLGLLIIGLITLILIPTLSTMNNNYNNYLKTIEIKKSIITSLNKFSKEQLKQGVVIDQYEIQLYQKKICGKDRDFNIKTCVSFEN